MSRQPKLKVPSLSFIDKTPTPTRLLKAVDEIGLFREDEKISSAKSTSSNNPFDEHFRKALNKKDVPEKKDPNDDVLNTPQIFHDIQSAPPSAAVILPAPPAKKKIPIPKKLRPIYSAATASSTKTGDVLKPSNSSSIEKAQLLLKIPSGGTIQLSQIPFIKQESDPLALSDPISVVLDKRVNETSSIKLRTTKERSDDLRTRNRAAAFRARKRKREMSENLKQQVLLLSEKNKALEKENESLKNEVLNLRNQLSINKAPVIIALNQKCINPT